MLLTLDKPKPAVKKDREEVIKSKKNSFFSII
jgi:hypothetical protein